MVNAVKVVRQWKVAVTLVVVGVVAVQRHNPVITAYIAKVHAERVAPAHVLIALFHLPTLLLLLPVALIAACFSLTTLPSLLSLLSTVSALLGA